MKRNIQTTNMVFTSRKRHTYTAETAYLRGGNNILSSRHLRNLLILFLMTIGASGAWGQSLPSVTTSSNTYLYQFNLGKDKATGGKSTFYMMPSSSKVSIKENPGDNEVWYVLETDDIPSGTFTRDHIAHYCYIVNAVSGEYLYYTGTNSNTIETNVVEMKSIDAEGAEADRFKFIIKRSGNSSFYNIWFFTSTLRPFFM